MSVKIITILGPGVKALVRQILSTVQRSCI